jgi:hypothetical protein
MQNSQSLQATLYTTFVVLYIYLVGNYSGIFSFAASRGRDHPHITQMSLEVVPDQDEAQSLSEFGMFIGPPPMLPGEH